MKISSIRYFLPEKLLSNSDLEREFPDFRAEKIEQKVGIVSRHISSDTETALDLAEQACRKLPEEDLKSIDFILFCTQSPDYPLPPNACFLQSRLGLSNKVGAFDFNLGCSGFVYGLAMVKGLIAGNIADNILLVTAETYSKYLAPHDKANRSIFGDAAAVTLISKSAESHIGEFALYSDGGGAENLIVRNGGARNPGCGGEKALYMNGPEIFSFTLETIPAMVGEVLKLNKMSLEDVDFFVFHQANKYMLDFLRKTIKISESKFYIDLRDTGNTVSATIPIALKNAYEAHRIKDGDRVLIAGFGVGYSYGATVITV